MATFTQLNPDQIQQLAQEYELSMTEYEPLVGGNGNSSYILKTESATYVLTVCDDKEFDEVSIIAQLLKLLEAHHIPCTRLISPLDHVLLTTFEGKAVMLKGYIEGQVIEQLNEQQLKQVGEQAATLNQIPPPDYIPTEHPYGRTLFPLAIGLNIDNKYETWLAKELAFLNQNVSLDLPRGLIHGDLFYDNFLFGHDKAQDQFIALLDFEEACHYYLVFELGMAIVGTCVSGDEEMVEGEKIDFAKARALVGGYQKVRPLAQLEKASLQMFVRYAATATSYWRFNQYNVANPSDELAGHHWGMVKLAQNVTDIPSTEFLKRVF
ncbi:MAG: homoserine kinase [Algicola sp.]|nr:homoserine kinase [Algicola sp.]